LEKYEKNAKKEKLLWRYTLYIIFCKNLRLCCHVGMTVKEGCVSRVEGRGSEGDTGITGSIHTHIIRKCGKLQMFVNDGNKSKLHS
jgi:hypothetical protein